MLLSRTLLMGGIAAAALATPAFAEDPATGLQKDQYLYQQSQDKGLGAETGAENDSIGATKPRSGPGVQGPADTRTGPSTRAPGDSAAGNGSDAGSAASGASSGETGMSGETGNTTKPSQDSSGVQGFPDTRTGPATHTHEDSSKDAGSAE